MFNRARESSIARLTVDSDLPLILHCRVRHQLVTSLTGEELLIIFLLRSEGEDSAGDIPVLSSL